MSDIEYSITPQELLEKQGIQFKRANNWLGLKLCIFCSGGSSKQQHTFAVHEKDGNFNCLRTKCGKSGSFWSLLQHFGYNPKDFIKHHGTKQKKLSTSRFVYGKKK